MFIIKAENLSKIYSLQRQRTFKEFLPALFSGQSTKQAFHALSNLNFEINKGESLGILGRNGSGKSTLLKIIAGVTKPSDGRITVNGKVRMDALTCDGVLLATDKRIVAIALENGWMRPFRQNSFGLARVLTRAEATTLLDAVEQDALVQ